MKGGEKNMFMRLILPTLVDGDFSVVDWVTIVVNSVKEFLGGLGIGLNDFFVSAFVNATGTGPNELAIIMLMFIGLTIALAVIRLVWRAVVR